MKLWKILGLAGLAGVAATGVVIARDERRRSALTPDEVRARLHARMADAEEGTPSPAGPGSDAGAAQSRLDVQ